MNWIQWKLRGYFIVLFGVLLTVFWNTSAVNAETKGGLPFVVQVAFQNARADQVNIDIYAVEDLNKIKAVDGDDGYVMDPTNIPIASMKTDGEGKALLSTITPGHYIAYAWGDGYDDMYNSFVLFSVSETGDVIYEGRSKNSTSVESLPTGTTITETVVLTLRPKAAIELLMVGNQNYLKGKIEAYNYAYVQDDKKNYAGTTYQIFVQDSESQGATSKVFNAYTANDGNSYTVHEDSGNRTSTATGDQIIYLKPNETYFFQQESFSNKASVDTNKPYNFFVTVAENGNITQVTPDDKTGEIYGYSPLWGKKINVNENGEAAIEKSNNEMTTLIVTRNESTDIEMEPVMAVEPSDTNTPAAEESIYDENEDVVEEEDSTYAEEDPLTEEDYVGTIPDNFQTSTVDGVYIKYDEDGNPIGYFEPIRGANGEIIWVEYGAREGDLPYKDNPETLDTLSFARIAFVVLIFGVVFVVDRMKAKEHI